jgi:hypothetical protein
MSESGHPLTAVRRMGIVVAVSATAGFATIVLGGEDISDTTKWVDAPCLNGYLPTVGDSVVVLSNQGDHLILGGSPVTPTWTPFSFATNVTDYGSPWDTCQWIKIGSIVTWRGLFKTTAIIAAGGAMWTMPVGTRITPNNGGNAGRFDATTLALLYMDSSGVVRTQLQLANAANGSIGGFSYVADS